MLGKNNLDSAFNTADMNCCNYVLQHRNLSGVLTRPWLLGEL
jgi:hypothetical protein